MPTERTSDERDKVAFKGNVGDYLGHMTRPVGICIDQALPRPKHVDRFIAAAKMVRDVLDERSALLLPVLCSIGSERQLTQQLNYNPRYR